MKNIEDEKKDLQEVIIKEGEELRKSLLDKLFNLNTLLSATFLVLFQLDTKSSEFRILNILPFCTVTLILLYQLFGLRILGSVYYKLDNWKNEDLNSLKKMRETKFNIILISIILTIIEIGYLIYIFLK